MKLYIVDAFTDQVFGGNPAGVVYIPAGADFPDDETMCKTAAELRYSETAFLKELGDKKFHVRYFTPAAEVDLCGHATIATFYTLMKNGKIAAGDTCDFKTLAGDLQVLVTESGVLMDMGEAKTFGLIDDPAKLEEVAGKLMELKKNVALYDSDSPKSALISGDCSAGMIWSAEIAMAMEEVPSIKVVYPDEGAYLFFDNWVVTKDSPNYDNAIAWINFIMDPENMAMVLEEFPYLCANTDAIAIMGDEYSGNPAKNPPADAIAKGSYVENLDSETLDIYNEMWTRLKE